MTTTTADLRGRSLLRETDLTAAEFLYLVELGAQLRSQKRVGQRTNRLAGRSIALIFEKSLLRRRPGVECAEDLQPADSVQSLAHSLAAASGARITVSSDVTAAVAGVDFLYTDVWPALHNRDTHGGQQIYARRGLEALEVTEDVFESSASIVFDEAENKMHTIKATMIATIGERQ